MEKVYEAEKADHFIKKYNTLLMNISNDYSDDSSCKADYHSNNISMKDDKSLALYKKVVYYRKEIN